jgi:Gpi18-like mannosyltransferase
MSTNHLLDVTRSRVVQIAAPLLRIRKCLYAYEVYLSVLLIFTASRLIVVIGVNFGKLLVRNPDPAQWDAGNAWYYRLLRWDSGWYFSIIHDGYRYSDNTSVENSTVFFPLYPLVSYVVKDLFHIDGYLALLLVANVASLAVVLLMTKFVKDELGDEIALLSVAFFCFFPSSFFLSAGYSESLFLVFVLLSLILLVRRKFVWAAAMAGLSLGTRSTGIVMIPVILWEILRWNNTPWAQRVLYMAVCGVLATSGLLAYMAYLGMELGHPLAFAAGQAAWHSGTFSERFLSAIMLAPFEHSSSKVVGLARYSLAGLFLFFLALTLWSFARIRFAISLYGLGTLMLPYLTLGITGSMNRFVLMCIPAFMCMGIMGKGRLWLSLTVIGIFAALLVCEAAQFSQWYPVG